MAVSRWSILLSQLQTYSASLGNLLHVSYNKFFLLVASVLYFVREMVKEIKIHNWHQE